MKAHGHGGGVLPSFWSHETFHRLSIARSTRLKQLLQAPGLMERQQACRTPTSDELASDIATCLATTVERVLRRHRSLSSAPRMRSASTASFLVIRERAVAVGQARESPQNSAYVRFLSPKIIAAVEVHGPVLTTVTGCIGTWRLSPAIYRCQTYDTAKYTSTAARAARERRPPMPWIRRWRSQVALSFWSSVMN